MKLRAVMVIVVLSVLLFCTGVLHAANGDLVVGGNLTVSGSVNGHQITSAPTGSAIPVAQANGQLAPGWIQLNPTTQNVVTSSRAFGTVYQNTTGKPMWVTVWAYANLNTGAPLDLQAYAGTVNPPTTLVDRNYFQFGIYSQNATVTGRVTFLVLPNYYYEVTSSVTPANWGWAEWN